MTTGRPFRLGPFQALLVSALVLPGLGQILSGRQVRGALMVGAVTLSLPLVLIKVISDFGRLWPALAHRLENGEALALADLQAAAAPLAGGLAWALGPLLAVWLWSFIDAFIFFLRRAEPAERIDHARSDSG